MTDLEENWVSRIIKVKNLLKEWSKRKVSIIGKILIVKTFGLSQFIFVMKSLILPGHILEQINSIFYKFIWSNDNTEFGRDRVKRGVMCSDRETGGLNMIDMKAFQKSIMLQWVEDLISDEMQNWKALPLFFYKHLGGKRIFRCNVSTLLFRGLETIKSTFWKKILENWLFHTGSQHTFISRDDPIHNNLSFTFKGKPLYLRNALKRSCITLKDFLVDNRLMTLLEYRIAFGRYPGDILDHNIMFNALNRIDLTSVVLNKYILFKEEKLGKIGRKNFYKKILDIEVPKCVEKWYSTHAINIDCSHWKLLHLLKESKLKAISWKIIHRIYPTNRLLAKMEISDTELCQWCNDNEVDTLEHFFCSCPSVKQLWIEIAKDFLIFSGKQVKLDEKIILLGANLIPNIGKTELFKINQVIAVGKHVVSKFKYGPQRQLLEIYRTETKIRNIWQ